MGLIAKYEYHLSLTIGLYKTQEEDYIACLVIIDS